MNSGNYNRSPFFGQPQRRQPCLLPTQKTSCGPINSSNFTRNFSINSGNFSLNKGNGISMPAVVESSYFNNNPLINGVKNIINGVINHPVLNCDFYTDQRSQNPIYRNDFVKETSQNMASQVQQPEAHIKTVVLNIGIAGQCNPFLLSKEEEKKPCNMKNPISADIGESDFVAIFTSEDFPELPVPKPCTSTTASVPTKIEKPPQQHKPKSKQKPKIEKPKFEYFEISLSPDGKEKNIPKSRPCNISRVRTISEDCDSNDSFIIFASSTPPRKCPMQNNVNNKSTADVTPFRPNYTDRERQLSSSDDDNFVICFAEYSDSDETDSIFSDDSTDFDMFTDRIEKTDIGDKCDHIKNVKNQQKEKKVRFHLKPEVHVMCAWDYAYREARKGHWENYARDRCRFRNRVENLSKILNPILDSAHRGKIYKTRFCDISEKIQ